VGIPDRAPAAPLKNSPDAGFFSAIEAVAQKENGCRV